MRVLWEQAQLGGSSTYFAVGRDGGQQQHLGFRIVICSLLPNHALQPTATRYRGSRWLSLDVRQQMKIYWRWKSTSLNWLSLSLKRATQALRAGLLFQVWLRPLAVLGCSSCHGWVDLHRRDRRRLRYATDRAIQHLSITGGVFAGFMIGWSIYSVVYFGIVMNRLRPHFRDYLQSHKV